MTLPTPLCARAGTLRKIDLVSTVGVWGRTPGHMPERRLPEVSEFHNTYEAAKAEAERVVWNEGDGLRWIERMEAGDREGAVWGPMGRPASR